jgi:hypothetical protein
LGLSPTSQPQHIDVLSLYGGHGSENTVNLPLWNAYTLFWALMTVNLTAIKTSLIYYL